MRCKRCFIFIRIIHSGYVSGNLLLAIKKSSRGCRITHAPFAKGDVSSLDRTSSGDLRSGTRYNRFPFPANLISFSCFMFGIGIVM
jgi:hypothetical protein